MQAHIVVYPMPGRKGARRELHIPVDACTGNYERLSDLAIRDLQKDLDHEMTRRTEARRNRAAIAEETGGWSPFDALRGAA